MPLINQSLPNLVQGVSQQPPVNRFAGQAEEQVNAMSSVVDGLVKRPNTRHLAELLSTAISNNSFIHFIDRTDNEKYVTIHDGTSLRAWHLDGTPCTINGQTSFTSSSISYLDTAYPRTDLQGLTIGDTTFLLNKTKDVVTDSSKTTALPKDAVITVTQGDYEKDYRVDATVSLSTASAPSGYVAPTFNITFESYFTHQSDGYYNNIPSSWYFYKWRVASITTTNAGANIPSGITPVITVSSSNAVYTDATFNVNVSGGSVQGNPTITNAGSYEGLGGSIVGYGNPTTSQIISVDIDEPTFTTSVAVSNFGTGDVTLYAATESGGSGGSTPTSSNANSDKIASQIHTQIVASVASTSGDNLTTGDWGTYFDTTYEDNKNNIYLVGKPNVGELAISTTDSLSNTGLSVAYKKVDDITNLPAENKNGFRIEVVGATDLNEDNYYVEFETDSGGTYGKGVYNETVGFDISKGFTNTSMPYTLVNTAVYEFQLVEGSYNKRLAGDDDTNPQPSFVNSRITNMFFFKNRLGFLSEDKVIMSEAGEPFNFFRTTVTTLLDSDPIDVQVSSTKVTNLKSATGFQENLILFSENTQFVLKGGEMLTPKTVSVTPVTNFDASSRVNPIPLGAYMYFPSEGTNFTSVREYTVNASTDVYDSADITEHIPAYIPFNVTMFAGTSTEDALVLSSETEPNAIYVYKFFFNGQKKLLSSWFKFTIDGEVRALSFSKSDLYLVVDYNNTTQLLKMPFNENLRDKDDAPVDFPNSEHTTYLDYRAILTVSQGDTSVALPYSLPTGSLQCYTANGGQISGSNTSTHFNFSSPITADQAGKIWVGKPFTMTYVFSELVFKDQTSKGQSPSNSSKMMLKNGTVFYAKTKRFTVEVKPSNHTNRPTQIDEFSADVVGETIVGNVHLDDGKFRFPIFSDAQDTKIKITDNSIFPVRLTSAEFEALVKPKSKRIG